MTDRWIFVKSFLITPTILSSCASEKSRKSLRPFGLLPSVIDLIALSPFAVHSTWSIVEIEAAGNWKNQSSRVSSLYASLDLIVQSSRLCRIISSRSHIQNSTLFGAVATGALKLTFSFSMLFMATSSLTGSPSPCNGGPSSKSAPTIASKHLRRCGCTAMGSRV